MNSSSFINTYSIYFPRDFHPALAGTRFGRLCWSVHGSGQVCPDSVGCQSKSPDMDSSRPAFLSGAPRPVSSSLRGPSPQVLTLFVGARFITRRLKHPILGECWRGPRNFWSSWTCPEPGPTYKRPYATLILSVGRTTNTDFLPAVKPDSSDRHSYLLC